MGIIWDFLIAIPIGIGIIGFVWLWISIDDMLKHKVVHDED